jgi:hypothetical protein
MWNNPAISYPRNNFFDRTEIQNHPIIVKIARAPTPHLRRKNRHAVPFSRLLIELR